MAGVWWRGLDGVHVFWVTVTGAIELARTAATHSWCVPATAASPSSSMVQQVARGVHVTYVHENDEKLAVQVHKES